MRTIYLIFIIIFCCSFTTRKKLEKNYTYNDIYGNIISFEQGTKLPKGIDTFMIKSSLNGKSFIKDFADTVIRFEYHIKEIKKSTIKNEYTFEVFTIPKTDDIEKSVKYLGYTNYKFKVIKKEKIFNLERLNERPYNVM